MIPAELQKEFEKYVYFIVGLYYYEMNLGKNLLWKPILHDALAEAWELTNSGEPSELKRELGDEAATKLFKEVTNEIINDKKLLKKAVAEYRDELAKSITT